MAIGTARVTKKGTRFLIACALASGLVSAEIAAATVLVVRSSGPAADKYAPGKALPDDARVALGPADVLVVLAADATRTLRGPGTFALQTARKVTRPAVNKLRRGRFSALRTAGIVPRSPTLWHVDVSQSGKVCLADKTNVMLWRPDATAGGKLTLTAANGATQTADWPAGEATLAWPSQVPIQDGAEYRLDMDGANEPTKLSFATLASVPTDVKAVAESLIEKKCDNQLDLLIGTVPAETTPADEEEPAAG